MATDFKMYVPIEKIDTEKRTVSGWATTEDIDKQSEIVDYNGSKEAFKNWQGNIREMHEPKAVGKAIEIVPNDEDKKIFVRAYISKGASDTWEKLKDGTLTGFSIGGKTIHKQTQIVKDVENNSTKTISRITKYKLNELSLVDNPANAECSFTLVKSVNGVPFQTEVVEDLRKILISEAIDPLQREVEEHREKADALIKKTLNQSELEKLADEDFGIIRKYTKGDITTKERLIPMPDKVHAVRALEILSQYNLNKTEEEKVLEKAKDILGSAYEDHFKRLTKGGETDDMNKEQAKQITDAIESVNERLQSMEKAYEGAYKPIPGTKDTPAKSTENPNLGESAPIQAGAADDVETQHPEGRYPAKSPEPEKSDDDPTADIWKAGIGSALRAAGRAAMPHIREAGQAVAVKAPKVGEAVRQVGRKVRSAITAYRQAKSVDGVPTEEAQVDDVTYVFDIANDIGKLSDEEYDNFVKSLDDEQRQELEHVLDILGKAEEFVNKAANPATSDLETQEGVAAPVKKEKVKKDGDDSRGDKYPGKHVATTDTQTQPAEGAYPAKGPIKVVEEPKEKAEKTEDISKSENDFAKVMTGLDSLRKRIENIERQPKPRKYKVEKNLDDSTVGDEELETLEKKVLQWNASGKELTPEQEAIKKQVLDRKIDAKFGKNL